MKCYVVDDEIDALEVLCDYIVRTRGLTLIKGELDSINAFQFLTDRNIVPDLVFLDINMPNIGGLNLKKILSPETSVIFATGYADYAKDGFDLGVVDFLLKPFSYERFLLSIDRAKESRRKNLLKSNPEYIFLNTEVRGKKYKVNIKITSIQRIESMGNYIKVFTSADSFYLSYISISTFMENLPARTFLRCHKSHIVNISFIDRCDVNKIIMTSGQSIPVGKTFRGVL